MTQNESEKEEAKEKETQDEEREDRHPSSSTVEKEEKSSEKHFEEKYLRTLAEMENMRKRLLKEQKDFARLATEKFIVEMLNPIDRLEEALSFSASASDEVRNWAIGFEMILQQFRESLANQGVHSFSAEGQQFDPLKHDAIEGEERADEPAGKILKCFCKGYKMFDRIIRPAKVAVAKPPKSEQEQVSCPENESEKNN